MFIYFIIECAVHKKTAAQKKKARVFAFVAKNVLF